MHIRQKIALHKKVVLYRLNEREETHYAPTFVAGNPRIANLNNPYKDLGVLQQTPELQTSTLLPANRALKASLPDLSKLLSPVIIRCGPVNQEVQQTPELQTSTFLPECRALEASLADLSRLLSPAILHCGPCVRI
jgi:hypothetical protein